MLQQPLSKNSNYTVVNINNSTNKALFQNSTPKFPIFIKQISHTTIKAHFLLKKHINTPKSIKKKCIEQVCKPAVVAQPLINNQSLI